MKAKTSVRAGGNGSHNCGRNSKVGDLCLYWAHPGDIIYGKQGRCRQDPDGGNNNYGNEWASGGYSDKYCEVNR